MILTVVGRDFVALESDNSANCVLRVGGLRSWTDTFHEIFAEFVDTLSVHFHPHGLATVGAESRSKNRRTEKEIVSTEELGEQSSQLELLVHLIRRRLLHSN